MLDHLRRYHLTAIIFAVMQVTSAQETAGRVVTLDDWSSRSTGLLIGIIFAAIVTILFGAVAVRRSRKPN